MFFVRKFKNRKLIWTVYFQSELFLLWPWLKVECGPGFQNCLFLPQLCFQGCSFWELRSSCWLDLWVVYVVMNGHSAGTRCVRGLPRLTCVCSLFVSPQPSIGAGVLALVFITLYAAYSSLQTPVWLSRILYKILHRWKTRLVCKCAWMGIFRMGLFTPWIGWYRVLPLRFLLLFLSLWIHCLLWETCLCFKMCLNSLKI